jgi:hypothetical protein
MPIKVKVFTPFIKVFEFEIFEFEIFEFIIIFFAGGCDILGSISQIVQ